MAIIQRAIPRANRIAAFTLAFLVALSGLLVASSPALAVPTDESSASMLSGDEAQTPAAGDASQQGGGSAPSEAPNTPAQQPPATETGSELGTGDHAGTGTSETTPGALEQAGSEPGLPAALFTAPDQALTAPTSPTITVDADLSALNPDVTTTVTVRGSGFVANAPATNGTRPPLAGKFSGMYVGFGSFADVWQPSAGAKAATRSLVEQRWAVPAESLAVIGGPAAGGVTLAADGTFETTLALTKVDAKAIADGSWGIVTYPGSGTLHAAFETFTPVTFGSPAPVFTPKITVFRADGVTPLGEAPVFGGEQLVVKGSGFDPQANAAKRPPLTVGDPSGVYVVFGSFADNWRPSQGAAAATRKVVDQRWALTDSTYGRIAAHYLGAIAGQRITMNSDGTFVATLTAADAAQVVGRYGVFSYVAGGATADASQELETRVSYVSERPVPPAPQPSIPGDSSVVPQTAGSLTWGVSSGFRDYITGSIAKGSITTSGVGLGAAGYRFPQATSSWNAASSTGTVQFTGTVHFSGHGGLLSETFSNPTIEVSGASSGTLSAGGYRFALSLSAGSRTVDASGATTFAGVPVLGVLSGGGATGGDSGGGSFTLDPVTFTIGATNQLHYGSTQTVSQAKSRQTAASPPATTGITLTTPPAQLVEGGEVEFTAAGFQPNEDGILVVLYSEPTVLDTNAKADANGVVRWIGTLPEGLTGAHTLTLQGSVNAGTPITIQTLAEFDAAKLAAKADARADSSREVQAAGVAPAQDAGSPFWWIIALSLIVVAAGLTGVVVVQRRARR